MATGGAPELRGSVSEGPGRPPALVPGPVRAGTPFHPHFPLRDSISRCEKTPGSTFPSLATRASGPPDTPSPLRDSTSRRGRTRGHGAHFAFPLCGPPPPCHPGVRAWLRHRGTAGPPAPRGSAPAYGRPTASGSLCPAAPGSVCLGRKPRA